MHYFRLMLAFALMSLVTLSCKKENEVQIMDLKFPLSTYYISEGAEIQLDIQSGNQKYVVQIGDENLIETTLLVAAWPAGYLHVKGLKKGSTTLTVTDEVTGQKTLLKIHVVAPFLAMKGIGLIPSVIGGYYSTNQDAIRKKLITEPQYTVDFFNSDEVVILRRNAEQQFLIFKNEADVEKGIVHQSGTYNLDLTDGGSNKLTFTYEDGNKTVEFLIHPETSSHTILADFAQSKMAGPKEFNPQSPYSAIYLVKDFTKYFQVIDPEIERVELSRQMNTFPYFHHLKYAEGILN